jgi:hypothetical protein
MQHFETFCVDSKKFIISKTVESMADIYIQQSRSKNFCRGIKGLVIICVLCRMKKNNIARISHSTDFYVTLSELKAVGTVNFLWFQHGDGDCYE